MKTPKYCFPLGIQTVLPENYRKNAEFYKNLHTLQEFGFSGIELNMAHPDRIDLADVQNFLQTFDLQLTMFASGLTAKTYGLSLSSRDPEVRQRSVERCRDMLDFVKGSGAGIIIGFLKGEAVKEKELAKAHFSESLVQLNPDIAEKQVPVLIEATNRYESSVANTLEDAVELIKDFHNPYLRILPDTFHMNIEEADEFGTLATYAGYYDSLHISDNNRYFPGLGAIKFGELIQFLKARNYQGRLAIEGNLNVSFIEDVKTSMKYLIPLLS